MLGIIERHRDRVIERAILPRTRWKPGELRGRGPLRQARGRLSSSTAPTEPRRAAPRQRRAPSAAPRSCGATVRDPGSARASPRSPTGRVAARRACRWPRPTYYFSSKDELRHRGALDPGRGRDRPARRGAPPSSASACARPADSAAALAEVLFPDADAAGALLAKFEVYLEAARRPACAATAAHWRTRVHLARRVGADARGRRRPGAAGAAARRRASTASSSTSSPRDRRTTRDLERAARAARAALRAAAHAPSDTHLPRHFVSRPYKTLAAGFARLTRCCRDTLCLGPTITACARRTHFSKPSRPRGSSTSSGSPAAPTCRPTTRSTTPT